MQLRALLCLGVVLPLGVWAQGAPSSATMTLRAARLERLVPEMGRQLGRDLRVQDSLRDLVGLVQVTNLPVTELMTAMESAFDAKWVDMGSFSILTRDGAREEEIRRASLAFETENVRKQLERALAQPLNAQAMTDAVRGAVKLESEEEDEGDPTYWQKRQQLEGFSPATRAAREFLQLLGPAALAAMAEEDRVVYASRPTAWQRPLPPWGAAWMARLNERTAMWREVVNSVNAEQNVENPWRSSLLRPPPPNRMATADVMISVSRGQGMVSVSISGFTNEGKRTVQGNTWLQTHTDTDFSFVDPQEFMRPMAEDLGTVEVTPERMKPERLLMSVVGMNERLEFTQAERLAGIRTWLDQDPLGGVTTDLILAYAKAKGQTQLVAQVPDAALMMVRTDLTGMRGESQSKDEVAKIPVSNLNMSFHPAWGIMSLSTAGPVHVFRPSWRGSMNWAVNRRKAVQIAERLQQKSILQFEDLADFVADTKSNEQAQLIVRMAMALSGQSAESQFFGGDNISLLRLYGRMNAGERRAARQGGIELGLTNLRAPLRTVVEEMFIRRSNSWIEATVGPAQDRSRFYLPGGEEEEAPTMSQEEMQAFQRSMMEFQQKFYDGKYTEITYLLGTREAQPVLVNIKIEREDVMIAFDPNAAWGNVVRGSACDLSMEVAKWEAFAKAMPSDPVYRRNFQQFGTGQRETFSVTMTFGKPAGPAQRTTMYGRASQQVDLMASGEPKMGPYSSLPEPVRQAYEAALVQARKQYENVQFAPPRTNRRIRP